MAVTMGTVLSAQTKAGAGINAVMLASAGSEVENFMNQAEAYLCSLVQYDLITNWASLNVVYKLLFVEYVERSAAIEIVNYDVSAYGTIESENIMNVHIYRMEAIKKLLETASVQDFLGVS